MCHSGVTCLSFSAKYILLVSKSKTMVGSESMCHSGVTCLSFSAKYILLVRAKQWLAQNQCVTVV
jgi:hypothetical protein